MENWKINRDSIGFKIIFTSVLLAAIFLGSSFGYILLTSRNDLIELNTGILEYELQSEYNVIQTRAKDIESSLLALSNDPAIQGIINSKENTADENGVTYKQWKNRLESIFLAQMKHSDLYFQLRYIDENGKEIVRTDSIGRLYFTKQGELTQNKSDRDYFVETMKLGKYDIYVSQTDLNKEGDPPQVSIPLTGTIRFSTPIFDEETGERKGILISNVRVDKLIKEQFFVDLEGAENYIVDQNGFYIHHPKESKRWGGPNDLNTNSNLFLDFPQLKDILFESESGTVSFEENTFAFRWIELGNRLNEEKWVIIANLPNDEIFDSINKATIRTIFFGLGTYVLLFFVFLFVIKNLLKPMNQLIVAAKEIGKGKFKQKIKKVSNDEIGTLTDAFNNMTSQLSDLYSNLDNKVKKRTSELSSEKSKMETIVESIGDGVFVVDSKGVIILFNNMCSVLSGFKKEETIGKHFKEVLKFVDADTKKDNSKFIDSVLKSGRNMFMPKNTNLIRKDGTEISVADSAAPLKNKNGKVVGAVIVFRDVSKEREIDRSKTEFVSLASHQLRTPLTAIMWDSEMLAESAKENLTSSEKDLLDDIMFSNKRMIDLVNALLNTSRIDMGTFTVIPEKCDVKEITRSVIEEVKTQIKDRNITLNSNFEEKLPTIMADTNLMRIIIQNLITNAVKYTKDSGNIWIDWFKENKNLVFKVRDDGIGIPKEQQSKIFKKLFRADNATGQETDGNGLGLYLVKSVLEQVGGKISFKSKKDEGTTFTVKIPTKGMKSKEGNVRLT